MNWRTWTAINALIALVTISAVFLGFSRERTGQPHREIRQTRSQQNQGDKLTQPEERVAKIHIESVEDLTKARVDDLGAVPAVELTELLRRATPEQRLALALKFNEAPTDARTFGGMGIFFQAWAELDPKAALVGAFGINDVAMRKVAASTVVGSVSPHATAELIGFIVEHPDNDLIVECKNDFLQRLVSNWSQLDPEAASTFMDDLGDTKNRMVYEARSDIAYNWATLDPSAALDWVKEQEQKDYVNRSDLYNQAIKGWCRKDIKTASAYVVQHLDDDDGARSASSVVTAMFDQNNAADATEWVNHLPGGVARDQAQSAIASLWAAKDPSAAARWLATLPADEQTNGATTIAENWIESNWSEASRWIETLTGDVRDDALSAAVNRAGATRIDSLSVALSIGREETRNSTVENIIRNWAVEDPDAAETWLKGSSLSTEQQDHLRSVISATQQQSADVERVIVN